MAITLSFDRDDRDLALAQRLRDRGHIEDELFRRASEPTVDLVAAVLEHLATNQRLDQALEELIHADLPRDLADRLAKWVRRSEEYVVGTVFDARPTDADGPDTSVGEERPRAKVREKLSPFDTRYEFRSQLGRGGMGAVYEAYDTQLDRLVAIKIILHADEDSKRRFIAELRATARLEHPNILPVYAADLDESGNPYYVMKKVEGGSLWRAREGRSTEDIVRILATAARAVDYAHKKGFLHRDLKPDNIMIGDHGEVWVVDWGLVHADPQLSVLDRSDANAPSHRMTLTGYMMGTLGYAAPEQILGEHRLIAEPADVHGLGATLYELLTGRRPYDGTSTWEIIRQYERTPRRPGREVPSEISSVLMRSLAKKPADRHPTAAEFAEDLEAWLAGRLVPSHHYPALARLGLWIRSHPILTVAASLLFLGTLSLVLLRVNRLRLEAADEQARQAENLRSLREQATAAAAEVDRSLASARKAHADRLLALDLYAEPYLRIWDDSEEADKVLKPLGPAYPEGNAPIAAADREWRLAATAASIHLDTLDRVAAETTEVDLPDRTIPRLELQVQELAWALARARFIEDATIDTRSLASLQKTALLDPDTPGVAPEYVEVIRLWKQLPEDHPYRAQVAQILAARSTLQISPRDCKTKARLIQFITTQNPFGRRIVDPDVPPQGKTYDLPIGSYVLEVRVGPRPEDLIAFPRLLERDRKATIPIEIPHSIPTGFVYVTPGIPIIGGSGSSAVYSRHRVGVSTGFLLARLEVSIEQYCLFLRYLKDLDPFQFDVCQPKVMLHVGEGMSPIVDHERWLPRDLQVDSPHCPVYGVHRLAAGRYAEWNTEASSQFTYSLPRSTDLTYAASGVDGRQYPWGDGFIKGYANVGRAEELVHRSVGGRFVNDRSVFGAYDLLGNVAEWTGDAKVGAVAWIFGGAWAGFQTTIAGCSPKHVTKNLQASTLGLRLLAKPK